MTMIFAAVALAIALPAMANAQGSASAPVDAKKCCCDEMQATTNCGKDMGGGDQSHAGHDVKPSADALNNRQ